MRRLVAVAGIVLGCGSNDSTPAAPDDDASGDDRSDAGAGDDSAATDVSRDAPADSGCGDSSTDAAAPIWAPAPGTTWQWQLTATPVDQSVNAAVFDIDGFDNDASVVSSLHAKNRHVICYLSVGSYENWRPDASQFPQAVLGKDYTGWPGEKWLDIRAINLLAPILRARFGMCKQKGFDAIEPDNIDGYQNDTGFPLTAGDQLAFNRWVADEAHARGLSIGLKNDADQTPDLLPKFDWALTEDCASQNWCAQDSPFVSAGKAVLMAEYTDTGETTAQFCPGAKQLGYSGILKKRGLDAWLQACP